MSAIQTNYYVQGMKCGGCIETANKALADVLGFEGAEYDLQAGTAVVAGNVGTVWPIGTQQRGDYHGREVPRIPP